jgi:hypothetical protein
MIDDQKPLPTVGDVNHVLSIYPLIADMSADFSSADMQDVVDTAFNAISEWVWESDNPDLDVFSLGQAVFNGSANIEDADLLGIRDMFTAIANSERFADGLFIKMLKSGRVQQLMQRLSKLKLTM